MVVSGVAPRTAGLLPAWSLLVIAALSLGLIVQFHRGGRSTYPSWRDGMAVAALIGANILFFWRPLFTPAEMPNGGGDLASYFFPLHEFAAAQLQSGHFPLWNPYLHDGMPQLANFQAAMLYPPNLIVWWLARPFRYGSLELLVLVHYLIASLGSYALARSLGMRRMPAIMAGIVFAYSGFLTAHLGHYSMLSAAVWLPFLLLVIRRNALSPSWLWTAAVAVVVFLATTAGHQQTLLYELTVAAVWWVFWTGEALGWWEQDGIRSFGRSVPSPLRTLLPRIASSLGGVLLGLLAAAPVLLPSIQLAFLSVRTQLTYEQSTEFSAEPIVLLHFILPKVFGSNPTDFWGAFSSGEIWGYVGVVTLLLAAIGLAVVPNRRQLLLVGLSIAGLLYALGPFTPIQGWIFRFIPGYDLIRAPARAYLIVDLSLALLGAYGLESILDASWDCCRLRRVVRVAVRAGVVVMGALLLFVLPVFYALVFNARDAYNRPVIVVDGLTVLVLILAGFTTILWSMERGSLCRLWAGRLLLVLVVLDLFSATAGFNPTSTDILTGFRHTEALNFLSTNAPGAAPVRIEATAASWQPDLALVTGIQDVGGLYDPMQLKSYSQALSVLTQNRNLPLYNMLGARFVITDDKADAPSSQFKSVLRTTDGLVIWENQSALPSVLLVPNAQVEGAKAALGAVLKPSFDPKAVVLVTKPGFPADGTPGGQTQVTHEAADEVDVNVEASGPTTLVLTEVNYPGWRASIDGRAAPLSTADGLFRAVPIPSGTHVVRFQFRPPLLGLSVALAACAWLPLASFVLIGLRARRHSRCEGAGKAANSGLSGGNGPGSR